jgi:hypothetical protein
MPKTNNWGWFLVFFLFAGLVGFVSFAVTQSITTDRLEDEHAEVLNRTTNVAFVRGLCLASGQSLGDCEVTISAGGQGYLIQGGVVLQQNGDNAATPALLPTECTGAGAEEAEARWLNDPQPAPDYGMPKCKIELPEAAAAATTSEEATTE